FYEADCQVPTRLEGATTFSKHTSSERAHPFNQPRGAPANGSCLQRVVKLILPRRNQRGDSPFYSRSSMARHAPAHRRIRRRSSALCGTALTCGQLSTRACSSSLTTLTEITSTRRSSTRPLHRQRGSIALAEHVRSEERR